MLVDSWDEEFEAVIRPHLVALDKDARIPPDLELRSAGLDSLALIELLVSIEDVFGLEFPDELLTAQTFRTTGTLWTVVAALRAGVGADAG
jgi:acyl carrier protein